MADDFVDAGAAALGEALVVERGWNVAVLGGEVVDEAVDVECRHAFFDVGCHMVKDGCVEFACLTNAFYLFGCLD